jgi:serine/threonine protein kinase
MLAQCPQCPQCHCPLDSDGNCAACLMQLGLQHLAPGRFDLRNVASSPSVEELAPLFPNLEISRLLGRGGMGAIYEARQNSLGRTVALKLLGRDISGDSAFVDRFEREARALAMLSHPNIVTVFDFGRTANGLAYLIMEFVDGANLRQAMTARRLTSTEAIELMLAIGKAIEYAHGKGVVHRDLKPENILLGEDGTAKVADFGIAKIVNDPWQRGALTATRQVLGSPHYLAPEQLEAPDQVDHRIDLYALGVIFYELLTGQLPLGVFEAPSAVVHDQDPRLDAIVLKLLHRNPSQRYQTTTDFLNELAECASDTQSRQSRPATASLHRPPSVPFTAESHGGLAEAQGILQVTPQGILVEYIVIDALFGGIKSGLNRVELAADRIIKMSLSQGVFSCKLNIVTNDMTAISQLPGGESGQVRLVVKNADRELAEQVVKAMGFGVSSEPRPVGKSSSAGYFPAQALAIMLCGLLNGGVLAIIIIGLWSINPGIQPPVALISACITFGLLIMVQILGGFVHLVAALQAPWRVTLLASALPITPVFLVSFPIAAWWWYQSVYRPGRQNHALSGQSSAGWTATTLLYLRENRTARLLSILNIAGIGLLTLAAMVYLAGWYPTTMRFRTIASSSVEQLSQVADWESRMSRRLEPILAATVAIRPELERLDVRCWHFQRPRVAELLRIPKAPRLVLIAGNSTIEEDAGHQQTFRTLDLASGLQIPSARAMGVGLKVRCSTAELLCDQQVVRSMSVSTGTDLGGPATLLCQWSVGGREAFNRLVAEQHSTSDQGTIKYVGLVIDGMVHAFAELNENSNQQLQFALSDSFYRGVEAIQAAVRGPEIPVELELIR